MMHSRREIFTANEEYPWFRDPYLARLPDGSLCCAFLTGGSGDGAVRNVVAGIRSDDDGASWSDPEVLMALPDRACAITSLVTAEFAGRHLALNCRASPYSSPRSPCSQTPDSRCSSVAT